MNTVKKEMLKQPAARILYRNNNAFDIKQNLQNHQNQNHQNQKVDQHIFDMIESKLRRPITSNKNHHLQTYVLVVSKQSY